MHAAKKIISPSIALACCLPKQFQRFLIRAFNPLAFVIEITKGFLRQIKFIV